MSNTFDIINATFELSGCLFIGASIRQVLKDKSVAGVSWLTMAFFFSWGMWNLIYYPSLGQWWSFAGGVGVTTTNLIYLSLIIYYKRRSG